MGGIVEGDTDEGGGGGATDDVGVAESGALLSGPEGDGMSVMSAGVEDSPRPVSADVASAVGSSSLMRPAAYHFL